MALVLPPCWMSVSLVSSNDLPPMLTALQESIQRSMPLPGVKPPANTGFPGGGCEDPPDYPPFRVVPRRTKGFEGMEERRTHGFGWEPLQRQSDATAGTTGQVCREDEPASILRARRMWRKQTHESMHSWPSLARLIAQGSS
jgi:hypothetical protein